MPFDGALQAESAHDGLEVVEQAEGILTVLACGASSQAVFPGNAQVATTIEDPMPPRRDARHKDPSGAMSALMRVPSS